MIIKKLLIAMTLISLPFAAVATESFLPNPDSLKLEDLPTSKPYEDVSKIVSKYGRIIESSVLPVGGLTAWTVEKNGEKVILYTTGYPERTAVIAGIVWDPQTGQNLSNSIVQKAVTPSFLPELPPLAPPAPPQVTPSPMRAAMDGIFTGEIPEAMRTVDALQGVKEGRGGIADTVYVIIDPRCPYCQKAYQLTRPYVAQGRTIKWIPTAALGNKAQGIPLAATILNEKDPEVLNRVLGGHEKISTVPTPEIEQALDLNLSFMFAAFEQNGGRAGVPVAFYIDRRTGKPKMMTGLSDQIVLNDIFGQPPAVGK